MSGGTLKVAEPEPPDAAAQAAAQAVANTVAGEAPVRRSIGRPSTQARAVFSLNQGWFFRRVEKGSKSDAIEAASAAGANGHPAERVNLPHSLRLEPLNASGGRNDQGVCWYWRKLHVPAEWEDRTIHLQFEGAMQVAEVWVNGRKAGAHHCGYTPFAVDIGGLVRCGSAENVVAVRLDNSDDPQVPPGKPQRELDFAYFGGLYRNVKLRVSDRLHITDPILEEKVGGGGVFVTYPRVSAQSATVRVQTDVRNGHLQGRTCVVRQELSDPSGRIVAETSTVQTLGGGAEERIVQTMEVANPRLWHPEHPHLYLLRTVLEHQGMAADDQVTRIGIRNIRFDKEQGLFINGERFVSIGANRHQDHPYVGCAMPDSGQRRDLRKLREAGFTSFRSHYPQSPAFMDACDELGMLSIVSNPGWQFVGDEVFRRRAVENARRMVRRDRNRPSVILWEAALNESDNQSVAGLLQQAVHEEYPGDQCHTGGDREAGGGGWDVEYLHNDGNKPYWIREWGDHVDNWSDQQSRSRVRRGWGETPMLTQARAHIARLDEVLSAGKRLSGACLWAGIDCQRGYHHQPFHGGVLDLFRLPKFNYYFFQSQRNPAVHVPGLEDGPMVFIASFATFFSPTQVAVFSNCEEVRFLVDGREIGRRGPDAGHSVAHPPFTFTVESFAREQSTMYMNCGATIETPPMELRAQGMIGGEIVATHVVRPPGVAKQIVVEPDLCGEELSADGSDWIRVHARICDARGMLCPLADDLVSFSVEGPGGIIGGSGDIGANPVRAEAGIATALVQAGGEAGIIQVTASAFGLAPGRAAVRSIEPECLSR